MKQLATILLITALLASCKPEAKVTCLISGSVKNMPDTQLSLIIGNKTDTLKLNADGTFSKEVSVTKATDAILRGAKMYSSVYLAPGGDLNIIADGADPERNLTFSGSLAAANDYLIAKDKGEQKIQERLQAAYRTPYKPADFKRIRDSINTADLDMLAKFTSEKGKLDKAFIERQKTAIRFGYYSDMNNYPMMTEYFNTDKPAIPADWYSFMDGVVLDNPALLDIPNAKYFITSYISAQTLKNSGLSRDEFYKNDTDVVKLNCKYLQDNFKNPEFYNLLAYEFLEGIIESAGPKGLEGLVGEYMTKSTDEANKTALKGIVDTWAPLNPGQPAPVFNLPDNTGKMVLLTDFAGKYVFIDFWATWCGPCKAEVPAYKKLIEDYKNKNIVFISISVDKDKSAWEKMVKEGIPDPEGKGKMIQFTWLQLHDAVKYNKGWLVKYIPTFVLIDPQGKIVNARAERPSDEALRGVIDALPGV
ncbi:MAG: TlpA disulfide reductase family protein [Bacteroidales bacterium]|nr:TlpA disulfide reductase family protein [Bacteroidales bacterium]